MTRAIEDKKEFTDFNVIHVSAEFTLDSGTTESGNEETVTKYTILTLENGKWVNKRTEPEFEMSGFGTRLTQSSPHTIWRIGMVPSPRSDSLSSRWCWIGLNIKTV